MQPNPMADTAKLLFPSFRFCIVSPTSGNSAYRHRMLKHTFLKPGAIAYSNDVLARFSKLHQLIDPVMDAARPQRAHRGSPFFGAYQAWHMERSQVFTVKETAGASTCVRRALGYNSQRAGIES